MKNLRPECVAVDDRASCESSPFTIDADGIKRRAEVLASPPGA